jgi:hypothetical protein
VYSAAGSSVFNPSPAKPITRDSACTASISISITRSRGIAYSQSANAGDNRDSSWADNSQRQSCRNLSKAAPAKRPNTTSTQHPYPPNTNPDPPVIINRRRAPCTATFSQHCLDISSTLSPRYTTEPHHRNPQSPPHNP